MSDGRMTNPCTREGTCYLIPMMSGQVGGPVCFSNDGLRVCNIAKAMTGTLVTMNRDADILILPVLLLKKTVFCYANNGLTQCSVSKDASCYVYHGSELTTWVYQMRFNTFREMNAQVASKIRAGATDVSACHSWDGGSLLDDPSRSLQDMKARWQADLADFVMSN